MMKSGQKVFRYKTGAYTPVISDGRRIYLTGYSSINALQPVEKKPKQKKGAGAGGSAGSGSNSGQAQ